MVVVQRFGFCFYVVVVVVVLYGMRFLFLIMKICVLFVIFVCMVIFGLVLGLWKLLELNFVSVLQLDFQFVMRLQVGNWWVFLLLRYDIVRVDVFCRNRVVVLFCWSDLMWLFVVGVGLLKVVLYWFQILVVMWYVVLLVIVQMFLLMLMMGLFGFLMFCVLLNQFVKQLQKFWLLYVEQLLLVLQLVWRVVVFGWQGVQQYSVEVVLLVMVIGDELYEVFGLQRMFQVCFGVYYWNQWFFMQICIWCVVLQIWWKKLMQLGLYGVVFGYFCLRVMWQCYVFGQVWVMRFCFFWSIMISICGLMLQVCVMWQMICVVDLFVVFEYLEQYVLFGCDIVFMWKFLRYMIGLLFLL